MPVMWKCYHCKKEIAPRAPKCPHCGGVFNVSQNGFMEANARMDEDYAREKAGLPPKSGFGCAIPFALLIGGLVTVSSLLATSDLFAAETKQSNVDIIGLRTGMTFQQFLNGLPKKFNKKFSNLRDSNVTFRGNNSSSNTRVDFKGSGFWQVQDKHLREHIAITLAPDFLGKQVTTIERNLSFETYRNDSKAPLTNNVLNALRKKYGAPYWERKPTSQRKTGEMLFVFGKNETKSWFTTEPYPCEKGLKLNSPQWGFVGSNANMVQFGKQYGNLSDERCGPYIKVTYSPDGALLNRLSVTLVDVPLINDLMLKAFLALQAETQRKEQETQQNASGNTPKL